MAAILSRKIRCKIFFNLKEKSTLKKDREKERHCITSKTYDDLIMNASVMSTQIMKLISLF